MKGMIKNIVAASIAAIALNAHAGVLTFDDVGPLNANDFRQIGGGYGGFQ